MATCVVVTGAGGELGRSLLLDCANRTDIDRVVATTRMRSIEAVSQNQVVLPDLELTSPEGVARLRSELENIQMDRLGLVHCAGVFPMPQALHRHSLTTVGESFASNVLSFLGAVQAVLPVMRRLHDGRVVAFTSHTLQESYPFFGAFNLSKAALLSAIRTLANENARFGVAVNALAIATLQTETERRIKPGGPYDDWVPPDGVSHYALDLATSDRESLSGSEIHLWRYSSKFFGGSVFDRNSLVENEMDPEND